MFLLVIMCAIKSNRKKEKKKKTSKKNVKNRGKNEVNWATSIGRTRRRLILLWWPNVRIVGHVGRLKGSGAIRILEWPHYINFNIKDMAVIHMA